MFLRLKSITIFALGLAFVAGGVGAAMNGPGHIYVHIGGSIKGCLDQTMKWVVDGNCGVFTAKTLTSPSNTVVQLTTLAGPCCADSKAILICTTPNCIQNFIPAGTAGEFTGLHHNSNTFFSVATPTGTTAENVSYNIGTVGVNLFWQAS